MKLAILGILGLTLTCSAGVMTKEQYLAWYRQQAPGQQAAVQAYRDKLAWGKANAVTLEGWVESVDAVKKVTVVHHSHGAMGIFANRSGYLRQMHTVEFTYDTIEDYVSPQRGGTIQVQVWKLGNHWTANMERAYRNK